MKPELAPQKARWQRDELPVEARTRVGLASSRDLAVADDRFKWICRSERVEQPIERCVLGGFESGEVGSLECDADREIVAASAPRILRRPGVPGAVATRDELGASTVALEQEVRRDATSGEARQQ